MSDTNRRNQLLHFYLTIKNSCHGEQFTLQECSYQICRTNIKLFPLELRQMESAPQPRYASTFQILFVLASVSWYKNSARAGNADIDRRGNDSRLQLKCDGTRWRTAGEVKGKLANGVGSQYPSHYLGRESSITIADAHTSAASSRLNWRPPADLNGLVRFAERINLDSARVPSHFNWPLPHIAKHRSFKPGKKTIQFSYVTEVLDNCADDRAP